jgi:hypothetical protein
LDGRVPVKHPHWGAKREVASSRAARGETTKGKEATIGLKECHMLDRYIGPREKKTVLCKPIARFRQE